MTNIRYAEVKSLLASADKVVITSHKSPDGDAIGSSLALAAVLRAQGKQVSVMVPDAFPKFLSWMTGAGDIFTYDGHGEVCDNLINESAVVLILDYNRYDRVGEMGAKLKASDAKKIMIDHHIDPMTEVDHMLSDVTASSTAQLVYDFVEALGWEASITPEIGQCLYAGIMTDTGSFRFSSTSARTHEVVAQLMHRGLRPEMVHQQIFDNNHLTRLRLLGHALSKKLEVHANGKLAIIGLSLKEKNRFEYQKGDTEGLVNYGLSIQGVEVAVFVSEELNFVKISLRSKGVVNVNDIARAQFNGGGHRNAAGGRLDLNLNDALQKIRDVLVPILQ